jgi:hypothetical protein
MGLIQELKDLGTIIHNYCSEKRAIFIENYYV